MPGMSWRSCSSSTSSISSTARSSRSWPRIIKRDLGLKDEDLGFLYGTAFGVFYSLFGIPLGRLADNWHRVRLMTVGLALWSTMTAVFGLRAQRRMLAGAADRRRRRRGDRQPVGLFADLGLVPQAAARHRARHLFGRPLCRRRLSLGIGGLIVSAGTTGLARWAVRSACTAGRRRSWRSACPACRRAVDRDPARTDARRSPRAARPRPTPRPSSELPRGTAHHRAAAHPDRRGARRCARWSST
jgi:hypothetical protein